MRIALFFGAGACYSYDHSIDHTKESAMVAITKLSEKFQISIPKEVRDAQDWRAGQRFAFVPQGGGFLLVPVPSQDDLFGIAEGANSDDIRDRRDRI